ncbi:ABC transporter permease [Nocardioides panaciterrulae]|uniref:Simple sugar transport system permease protein n=1 Tax=Nocardioides panaciterrulae TaxID=661492 RepID=A0A7Y9E4H0_9ACTN|nr:ABC transporter permease [Nocardioides panaciterrulae]NYD40857.1 simple sugar transport system permease protein [Nocardioides panaciterrulae]
MSAAVASDVEQVGVAQVRDRADVHRQVKLVVVFAIVAVLLLWFALDIKDPTVKYITGERVTADDLGTEINGLRIVWICFALAVLALGAAAANRVRRGIVGTLVSMVVGIAFFVGFIVWSYADQTTLVIANPLPGTVKLATPLVFGALAGCLCERAGVINIAIEGQFLTGAFLASVFSSAFYSAEMGLVGGILAGVAIAALLAVFAMRYHVNQVVLGVVLIALATGLTSFLLSQIPDDPSIKQYLNDPLILAPIAIPGLADIPVIGPTLFNQTLLSYLMYASVVVVTVLLFQTKWGLRVRSVGEHPMAADTVGIKVNRIRWQAVLLGGVFAGLGGAWFTVGSTGSFDQDASAGNGFIALAAVIMGRWHPVWASLSAVFFGFMWTLQSQLAFLGKIPPELLRASPYLATIIAVAGFVGRVRPPAADGEPYVKS